VFLKVTILLEKKKVTYCWVFLRHFWRELKTSHWEAKVSLTISWQSAIALYEKKEHAFADNFIMLHTKQGPPAPSRTPLPCSTNVTKDHLFYFDLRMCRTDNKTSRPNIQVIYNLGSEKSASQYSYWFLIKLNVLAIQELLQFTLLHFALKKLLHFALESHYFRIDNFITFCVDVSTFCVSITFCISITFCRVTVLPSIYHIIRHWVYLQ